MEDHKDKIKELDKNDPDFFQKYMDNFPEVKEAFLGIEEPLPKNKKKYIIMFFKRFYRFLVSFIVISMIFIFVQLPENKNIEILHRNVPNILIAPEINSSLPIISEKETKDEDEELYYRLTEEDLPYLVISNAMARYIEERGVYPNEKGLYKSTPENWLSFKPNHISYKVTPEKDRYSLESNIKKCTIICLNPLDNLLELHFFVDVNKLGLVWNDQILALYPVASGVDPLPFKESKVLYRVVEPNMGTGPLGTRGLVLQDNFAIHGTDDPVTISERVSHGCLRMFNSDIEILYPYISKGTPFKVKKGKPSEPIFSMGLPPLLGEGDYSDEKTPDKVYKWKY